MRPRDDDLSQDSQDDDDEKQLTTRDGGDAGVP
jgi:hypothetical protein